MFISFSLRIVFYSLLKVLGNGEVLEFDTPSTLLANSSSYFASLVQQTGSNEAEYLRTLARRMAIAGPSEKNKRAADDSYTSEISENDPLLV